jgi:2,4-diketo-3-deoxy-L-fuconate hydrolase
MRIVNDDGRLGLLEPGDRVVDVEKASGGVFGPDPQGVYERWDEFRAWAPSATGTGDEGRELDPVRLRAVAPRPPQVFAVGLNYRDHAEESGFESPAEPVVFTKYASSFTGPEGDITLSPGVVDWEVELVAVIGVGGRFISAGEGWDHVAGLTVGQDISDRVAQFAAPPAQFGLGKSYPGFSPIGPCLVTPDELDDRDDIELGCLVNGEIVQKNRTGNMIFAVPTIVEKLSAIVTLLPGDVIFTGTPSGVGFGRNPPRYLQPGDELTTWCGGIGEMHHRFIGA